MIICDHCCFERADKLCGCGLHFCDGCADSDDPGQCFDCGDWDRSDDCGEPEQCKTENCATELVGAPRERDGFCETCASQIEHQEREERAAEVDRG
jgi:hypothetical protein